MSPKEMKDRERATWTQVAPGWRKHDALLRKGTEVVSQRMLDLARVGEGQRVLDVASGTGEPAIPAARRVGPTGHVLGIDFAEAMLELAREKAASEGLTNVKFVRVDGEEVVFGAASFDAVTIRWGLMFMPDPLACLSRVHAALRPGGRIAVACWAQPERNPFVSIPLSVLRRHVDLPAPPPGAPGIFAFADPSRLTGALSGAGFRDVAVEDVPVVFAELDSEEEALTMLSELAGPVAAILSGLPADVRRVVADEIQRGYASQRAGDKVVLRGVTWVASGSRQ